MSERDVDLLLMEELTVSSDFRQWFVQQFGLDGAHSFVGCWHSVTDGGLGESDLILLIRRGGELCGVLVENKVDAAAQPHQAARYAARGEAGVQRGDWQSFVTCIVAPERYLEWDSESSAYQYQVSYEQIAQAILTCCADDERAAFRVEMLQEAVEQNRRGYQAEIDPDVTEFWRRYYELVVLEFPSLRMKEPGDVPSRSDWPSFKDELLGPSRRIVHKMSSGTVDLELRGAAARVGELRNRPELDGWEVVQTQKSASIRRRVEPVEKRHDFELEAKKVRAALVIARELHELAVKTGVE